MIQDFDSELLKAKDSHSRLVKGSLALSDSGSKDCVNLPSPTAVSRIMPQLALVTGASSGLGKALAQALAKQNVRLILVARREELLKQLAKELPVATEVHRIDLSNSDDRKRLIQLIHQKTPDLVINNAGFGLYGRTLSQPLRELEEMVDVNVQALIEITLESARALQNAQKKGTILNISSAAAFFSYPTFSLYAATKAFVNSFSVGLDAELKSEGIRVLTACPGQINTNFRKRASKNFTQKKTHFSMTPEKAAALILEQIQKGKTLSIIGKGAQILVPLARLLPKCLIHYILKRGIRNRYQGPSVDTESQGPSV